MVRNSVGAISVRHIHREGIEEEFGSGCYFFLEIENEVDAVVGRPVHVISRAEATETCHITLFT